MKTLSFVLIAVSTFILISRSSILAKSDKAPPKKTTPATSAATPTPVSSKFFKDSIRQFETVKQKVKNTEVKEELEDIQEQQHEADETIEESLDKISNRSTIKKLIIGPDYKNIGQVRSEIVHLKNEVKQLTRLESKAPVTQQPALQASIFSLNQELIAIETRLNNSLQGFSLFGWLNKLLTGFVPPVTPTPSITPELSPSVSPTVTVTLTPSATPSVEPTAVPTI